MQAAPEMGDEVFSSAKELRRMGLDRLPVISCKEYENRYLSANTMRTTLPRPSSDLATLTQDLRVWGYCYVRDALNAKQLMSLKERTEQQAAGELKAGIAFVEGGAQYGSGRKGSSNQRLWSLLNKGKLFQQLATGDTSVVQLGDIIHSILEASLGRGYLLSAANANIAGNGGQAMFLHQDQGYANMPYPPDPLVMQVIFMMDDFNQSNGGTLLVPGSHTGLTTPEQFQALAHNEFGCSSAGGRSVSSGDVGGSDVHLPPSKTPTIMQPPSPPGAAAATSSESFAPVCVAATAKAGSALVFDGRLLHGTGQNITAKARTGVLMYYCRGWLRQQENVYLSLSPTARQQASPLLLQLLGFRPWRTLGQVQGTGAFRNSGFVERPLHFVEELSPAAVADMNGSQIGKLKNAAGLNLKGEGTFVKNTARL
jgi:ectoine hydroxylase-related dioxygenase (phytanoyl-CoA dioxygenase family)